MFEKVLFLEKMGCDFWNDETADSDIKNYRVRTHGEIIPGKDGKIYFLEFHLWRNRKQIRYTHKRTGRPLKHPAFDIINPQGVAIDTEYSDNNGCWRNCKLEEQLTAKNYSYTKADILTIVNEISTNTYDRIIFADLRAMEAVPHILTIAGHRETEILNHLTEVTRTQADKNYLVYRFYGDNNNYFEYEINSGRITG